MHFAFTEDTQEIADAVVATLQAECPPTRVRAAWEARDTEIRGVLAELGVFAINLPEEVGGLEMGAVEWVQPLEACGRFAVPTPVVETIATNPALVEAGLTELAEGVAGGEAFVALGQKGGYVDHADAADAILLLDGDQLLRVTDPQLTAQKSVDGTRHLFAVDGPTEVLSADAGAVFDRAALAAAAQLVGLSKQMLDVGVDYSKARRQFGKPIGAFQAVQHHLVDALLKIKFTAPAIHRAAWTLDNGDPDASIHVAMAKLYASETARFVAKKVLQVHGAIGYTYEHDLHMWMKRVWALSSAWGDPKFHLDRVGDHVLEAPHG